MTLAEPADAANRRDFNLGENAERQACRAVERFDVPRGGAAVDLYCGEWEQPSGHVTLVASGGMADARTRLAADCKGPETPLPAADLGELRQVSCQAEGVGLRRYGLLASRGGDVVVGVAYPADWAPMVAAARVLTGAAPRTAAAPRQGASTPGLREIEAIYPQGAPGQGAELNYELLRRRAFERNVVWNFASSERDFEALLRTHDAVNPDDITGRAEILAEIGLNLSNARRFSEAADTFARAAALVSPTDQPLLASKIANYRALDQLNQHHYGAARDMALAANRSRADPQARGAASISASDARSVDRVTAKSRRELLLQLDESTPRERAAVLSAQGFYIAAVAARALSDRNAERYLAAASSELLNAQSPPAWLSGAIANEEAELRLAAGDNAGAATRARAGLEQMRLVAPLTRGEGHLLLTLSSAQARLGQTPEAMANGRAAMAIFTHQLEEPGLPADLASSHLALLLAQWEATPTPALGAEYFESLALTWDSAAARSASQLAARLALRGAGDQARSYQDVERSYRAALASRERLSLESGAQQADITRADTAVETAGKRFAVAEANLRGVAPGYLELLNPSVATAELQQALGDKEGYLRIVIAQGGGFGALVTAASVHPFAVHMTRRQVEALTARVRGTTAFHGRRLPTYDIDAAAKLYGALVGPVAKDLVSLERLEVDVSGALASVPFAALVATPPPSDDLRRVADDEDYSHIDWMARRVAVANALGPAAFVRFRKNLAARAPAHKLLAAFGDFRPDAVRAAARIAGDHALTATCQRDVARALGTLGALPDTADEVRQVARAFGGQTRTRLGADFTDADFFNGPEVTSADVILLATHGVLGLSSCFAEPALLTSLGPTGDGLIEASRVLDRKLDARLVILSACDTAGAGGSDVTRSGLADGGEALSGLARGFLYAGAADVMATEWKIDSATSAIEVTDFLAAASKPGTTLAGALGAAQRKLYDSSETGHPFYWAAFILVGDGGATIGGPAPAQAGP